MNAQLQFALQFAIFRPDSLQGKNRDRMRRRHPHRIILNLSETCIIHRALFLVALPAINLACILHPPWVSIDCNVLRN
jgi:hypothetical protein